MNSMLVIAWKSINNRRSTTVLTILTIAMSILMLLGVEKVRVQAKQSFANTISSTDLIVGARSGQINLLLYSIFRIGSPTANISWKSYKRIISNPKVAWSIPISLGDSHRGFRVLGTNEDYFKYYKFGKKQSLSFDEGSAFSQPFSTIIGAQVAKSLNYKVGDSIVIAHGISDQAFNRHKKSPFIISGILAPTGTPVDRTVHVTLSAIDTIHNGRHTSIKKQDTANGTIAKSPEPTQITAFMMGLHSKIDIFTIQRAINTQKIEPLSAILPGIALYELWSMMSIAEQALLAVSVFVVIAGLLGVLSSLLTSLQYRSREIAILRAVGARPMHIIGLLMSEASLIGFLGITVGLVVLYAAIAGFSPYVLSEFGVNLSLDFLSIRELMMLLVVQLASVVVGFIPAFSAYSRSLSDGMTVRT